MTRFQETQALMEKNKAKKKRLNEIKLSQDSIEVPGITKSGKGGNPAITTATEGQDMDLLEQLYRKSKHIPGRGEMLLTGTRIANWQNSYQNRTVSNKVT